MRPTNWIPTNYVAHRTATAAAATDDDDDDDDNDDDVLLHGIICQPVLDS
jgi:hypothetical protein